jgi:antitoxin (DNA-binding transcriptional repressor) of toxin-antitoxin stability system
LKLDLEDQKMYNNVHYGKTFYPGEQAMREVSFTEFRKNAASFFDSVEQGETIRVLRHGKPVAEVFPVQPAPRALSWRRPGPMLEAKGASLSREILRERRRGRK